jgi:hypothetical protein
MKMEWYVNLDGKPQGLFTAEQVKSFIDAGKISKGSLVWRKGLISWEPVEIHFKIEEQQSAPQHIQPIQEIIAGPKNPEIVQVPSRNVVQAQPRNPIFVVVWLLLSVASIGWFLWIKNASDTAADTSTLTFNWLSTLLISVLISVFFLALTWRYSNSLWGDPLLQRKGGLLRLFCFFGSLGLLVYFAVFGYAGLTLIQISKARSAYNKYTIDVDPASNVLTIAGLIGPDLSRRIIDKLKVHSDIQTILVDSPGGLIDEALSAAKYIESRATSTVIAHGTCNSSCLLILMSGRNRLASWNMNLGFHAASAITNVGDVGAAQIADLGDESSAYLVRRGVPFSIVQKAKLKGSSKLETVSAIDLFDNGALTGLVDGDQFIDVNEAKWRFLESTISGTEFSNLSSVLSAIRESDQSLVKKYAAPIYSALNLGDASQTKQLMAELSGSITSRALRAAEGSALNAYVGVQFFQLRYLIKLEQWKTCVDYSNGNVGEAQSVLSKDLRAKEFEALAALIRSASLNKWKPQPIPSWVEETTTPIYREVVTKAIELNLIDNEGKPRNLRGQCIYSYMIFDKLLELDADTAAPVLRSILTQ